VPSSGDGRDEAQRFARARALGSKNPAVAASTILTMTPRGPDLGSPRGEAARGLSALIDERQQLDERLDALDEQQREARERVETLSAELAELERTAASGGQVSDAARTKAEKELTAARIKAAEP
jgi:predicted nuclease with TOPRIM domain